MESLGIQRTEMPNMQELIARHKSRYYLVGFFCRPGMRVLDFPCGSGYGSDILKEFGVDYMGMDCDDITLHYCRANYKGIFSKADLKDPFLIESYYDIIACIDGIEHIEKECQENALRAFHWALKDGGKLIISSPEKKGQTVNPYHKGEMTKIEFMCLLSKVFGNYQILEVKDKLHNGMQTTLLFGICVKEA